MKPELILDFDETLFETSCQMRRFLNWYFEIQIPIETQEYMCGHSLYEFVKEYLPVQHDLTEARLYEVLGNEFLASMMWHEDVAPLPGALELVPKLAQRYTLHIATARQNSSRHVVDALLERFFPGLITSIHFVWEHLGQGEFRGVPKKDFIQTLQNPFAYIDDNPKETREIVGMIKHVILFDPVGYHSNQEFSNHHVSHWDEIRHLLL